MVGMTGFEPATPSSQARCATKLRHIPVNTFYDKTYFIFNWSEFARCYLSRTILNRSFGRVKLRYIPMCYARIHSNIIRFFYKFFKLLSISAIMSLTFSSPTESLTNPGLIPQANNCSSVSCLCVALAGCKMHVLISAT